MTQLVFGVRDSKAEAFLQPFFSSSSGAAIRAFGDAILDTKSPLGQHPTDYLLYELGTFDDNSGMFVAHPIIKLLSVGADFFPTKPMPVEVSPNGKEA